MAVNRPLTIFPDNQLRFFNDSANRMIPASATSLDVAVWFLDRARADDTYLQPRKLQCLLFLAQAHFAAAYGGRPLMPSFFIVDEGGPMDPNLYRILENGRPDFIQTRTSTPRSSPTSPTRRS